MWTSGEPCREEDCAALTIALNQGEVELIEQGHWGPYNVILSWAHPGHKPSFFLAELRDTT